MTRYPMTRPYDASGVLSTLNNYFLYVSTIRRMNIRSYATCEIRSAQHEKRKFKNLFKQNFAEQFYDI